MGEVIAAPVNLDIVETDDGVGEDLENRLAGELALQGGDGAGAHDLGVEIEVVV